MRIFGFHDDHACGYYRVLLPLDALRDLGGHEIDTNHGWADRAENAEVIIGQRISRTEALPVWRRLSLAHRLVFEIDDDIWAVDPTNFSAYQAIELEHQHAAEHAIQVAHVVTVSTPTLAEVVRPLNPNVVVLPNCVDGRLLETERPRRDRLTIGWAGGDSHIRDLALIAAQLRRVLRQEQVEFHNIGTDYRKVANLPGRYTPWESRVWDYYEQIDFDIGLAPLVNSVFNASKSHIKALEYMALGVPVIASDSPAYSSLVVHGETGFLVRRDHEWRKYLRLLINDREMREEMGRKGRERARQWTIEGRWPEWEAAYAVPARKQVLEVAS